MFGSPKVLPISVEIVKWLSVPFQRGWRGIFYIGKTLLEVGFRHISPSFSLLQSQPFGGAARASVRFRFSALRNGGGLFIGFEVLGFSSTFFSAKSRPI